MVFKVGSNNIDTDDVAEGANKYFTNARAEGVSINNLSEDTTPQLGGALDVNGNEIFHLHQITMLLFTQLEMVQHK